MVSEYYWKKDYSSNLLANYKFEANTSNVCVDEQGSYNGTYANVTIDSDGYDSNCATFNGSTSQITFTAIVLPLLEKSIHFKIKVPTTLTTSSTSGCILDTSLDPSTTVGRRSGDNIMVGYANGTIGWTMYDRQNEYLNFHSNKSVRDGEWHEVLLTWDGTLNENSAKIYIDDMVHPDAMATPIGLIQDTSNHRHNLAIGKNLSTVYPWQLEGSLDDIQIFDKVIDFTDYSFLVKENGVYYNLQNYNETTQMYNEVVVNDTSDLTYEFIKTNGDTDLTLLFEENTIGSETFKPIDKFNNFQLILNHQEIVKAQGLKEKEQLVIAKGSFSTRLAKNIDFFELVSTISDTSSIKMAVSIDEGTTWKVYDNTNAEFVDLTNTCPIKEYSSLSEDELTQWNTFRDEVYTSGMNGKTLNTIDFNSIKEDNMMFAYVFNRDSYADACEMSKLQYQFDATGTYILLGESDVEIKQGSEVISVTPKKDIELMKVNIGSSGEVNIIQNGGTADIDLPTDEEVDNMINEVISDVFA